MQPTEPSPLWIIYAHGNACDFGHMQPDLRLYCDTFRANVVGWEYPGYGVSPGQPNATTVKRDAGLVYRFVHQYLGVPSRNIVLFGRSIGTGPSTYVAAKVESANPGSLGGLVLQSPYTSIRNVAKQFAGYLGYLAPTVFDNETAIKQVHCPVLLIHGDRDRVIHPSNSDTLHRVAVSPRLMLHKCPEASHNAFDRHQDLLMPIYSFLVAHYDEVPVPDIKPVPHYLFARNATLLGHTTSTSSWFCYGPQDDDDFA
jgi:pimeloyl-ACP methyl ester carboxylesterase